MRNTSRIMAILGICALGTLGASACGSNNAGGGTGTTNPLVGDWVSSTSEAGVVITVTLTLDADNTAGISVEGGGTCSGTVSYAGGNWTSTSTTITLAGTPSCTGAVMCTANGTTSTVASCTAGSGISSGNTYSYSLSADDKMLTIVTSDSDAGFTTSITFTNGG